MGAGGPYKLSGRKDLLALLAEPIEEVLLWGVLKSRSHAPPLYSQWCLLELTAHKSAASLKSGQNAARHGSYVCPSRPGPPGKIGSPTTRRTP